MVEKLTKKELMEKYGIHTVGRGTFGEGFFSCLGAIDEKRIDLFKNNHLIKRIKFAERNNLPYGWLLTQLENDWKRRIGIER